MADELISFLFDGKSSSLSDCMAQWLVSSRRFAAFVDTFRDKIRKKIRVIQDVEPLLDLQLELQTAYLLLEEKTFRVMYEPGHSKRITRAPDFAVTHTTNLTFLLEVTRMRGASPEKALPDHINPTLSPQAIHLADTICNKLGQLQPGQPNVLLIGVDTMKLSKSDLRAIMLHIQGRAEYADPAFLKRYGFHARGNFFTGYQRLSEFLVRGPNANDMISWVNSRAKHPLPSRVRTALYNSQAR